MQDYQKINFEHIQKIQLPKYIDTMLVSLYYHIIKHELKNKSKKLKVLDFGCIGGANSIFFKNLNFDVYGVDLCKKSIIEAKSKFSHIHENLKNNFLSITYEDIASKNYFRKDFDLIIAWGDILNYLDNDDMEACIKNFENILSENGILIAKLKSSESSYYKVSEKYQKGLRKIKAISRLNENKPEYYYLNFVLNNEDLIKKFSFFEKLHTGYIDYSFSVEENSKNNFVDNIFVGRKKII